MANEIQIDYESNQTIYAVIRNSAAQVWNIASQLFEDWGSDSHDADDYDIPLTDKSGSRYAGDFDPNITRGRYTVQVFLQSGTSPADTDELIGTGQIVWAGTAEITCEQILANKAIQNKLTGRIDYYDDAGQNIILTIKPSDNESELTRIPG